MPKRLLLPSAKSGVLLELPQRPLSPWWRRGVLAFGLVAVVIGGADVLNRFAGGFFDSDMAFTAFAPAALVLDPTLAAEIRGTSVSPFVPARVVISSIGVDASVEQVGKTAEGKMATPKALANAGWYSLGSKPGDAGNTVLAGHVNNALGFPGVFKRLSELKKGDSIEARGKEGESLTYEVESMAVYDENTAPLEEIFAKTGPEKLILITCEGEWDQATRTFDKRLIVVAKRTTP